MCRYNAEFTNVDILTRRFIWHCYLLLRHLTTLFEVVGYVHSTYSVEWVEIMMIGLYVRILKETVINSFSRKDKQRSLQISFDLSRCEVTVLG